MKGRVGFSDDDEEDTVTVIRRDTKIEATQPAFVRTRPAKTIRGISIATNSDPKEPLSVSESRDKNLDMQIVALDQELSSDDDELKGRIKNAREVRRRRAQDSLLEDYISLENTTQKHLDDYDIVNMIRVGSSRQRRPVNTWEDPEEQERTGNEPVEESSDGDTPPIDDGLDVEAFESHNSPSGRIRVEMERKMEIDVHTITEMDFEDDETRAWEMQQIQKGFSTGIGMSKASKKATRFLKSKSAALDQEPRLAIPLTELSAIAGKVMKQASEVSDHLVEAETEKSQIELHAAECKKNILDASHNFTESKDRLHFFQELQEHFVSFSEMVDELMPRAEDLEKKWIAYLSTTKHFSGPQDPELGLILDEKKRFFDQVETEFHNPQGLLTRLGEWKERYPESYEQSYIDLCVPGLMELYVRVGLVGWHPLKTPEMATGDLEPFLGEAKFKSAEVKQKIITAQFIPKLTLLISSSYSPLDPSNTKNLVYILTSMKEVLPTASKLLSTFRLVATGIILEEIIRTPPEAAALLKSCVVLANYFNDDNIVNIGMSKIVAVLPDERWVSSLKIPNIFTTLDLIEYFKTCIN